ncbi:LuxR C-terminal-related transcriptional regulator [Streptomyces monticola]|uniref:LuxR C-terminal-related transcriptional regulator n=1 Tax=Streptomyces monticola TaxID=2666263 RepID=A0ABW2JJS3_9ACTN
MSAERGREYAQELTRMLRGVAADLAAARRRTAALADTAARLMGVTGEPVSISEGVRTGAGIRVLEGKARIQPAVDEAIAGCREEFLSVKAGGVRSESELEYALPRALDLQRRGVRTRTLYNHTARHGHGLAVYMEQLERSVEVRTLDEVPDRLQLCDRTVAFLAGNADNTVALEVRQPELVRYLVTAFDCLWRLAVPLSEPLPLMSDIAGITHRERAIAALLADGHTDTEVAERLGINVRTCRHHIGKLAEALGSSGRTQLGVRIARAGLHIPPRVTGHFPPETAGSPPPEAAGSPPPEAAGSPPPEAAGSPPPEAAGSPPPEAAGPPPPEAAGSPPPEAAGPPPPEAAGADPSTATGPPPESPTGR